MGSRGRSKIPRADHSQNSIGGGAATAKTKPVSESDTKRGLDEEKRRNYREMAVTKKELSAITAEIRATMEEVAQRILYEGRSRAKDLGKLTKKRLYAYPQLKDNIERYKLDIEDVRQETFGKSKSIVVFRSNSGNGEQPTLEEQRAAKIRLLEQKIDRDETEIKEIEAALAQIKDDPYYRIVELRFFQKMSREAISEAIPCDTATVSRNLGRLLDMVNVSLYGADVLV